jgi:hypothetical protein
MHEHKAFAWRQLNVDDEVISFCGCKMAVRCWQEFLPSQIGGFVSIFSVIGPIDTEGFMLKIDRRPKLVVNTFILHTRVIQSTNCHIVIMRTNVTYIEYVNPFQSNFSANRILPSSYMFWAGKRLVDYL